MASDAALIAGSRANRPRGPFQRIGQTDRALDQVVRGGPERRAGVRQEAPAPSRQARQQPAVGPLRVDVHAGSSGG